MTRPAPDSDSASAPRALGVAVLGMHRSGTSITTRLLTLLGLTACRPDDLMPASAANPDGHWESRSLTACNDLLLAEIGCEWWSPPAEPITLDRHPDLRRRLPQMRTLFARMHPTAAPWVWKDPRTCLTLPLWRDALAAPMVAVVVLRDPVEIAASLHHRDTLPVKAGAALWERYLRHLLAGITGLPTLITRYIDLLADPAGWCSRAPAPLLDHLALPAPRDTGPILAAVRPAYRHHRRDGAASRADTVLTAEQVRLDALATALAGWHPGFRPARLPDESPTTPRLLAALAPPDSSRTAPQARSVIPDWG